MSKPKNLNRANTATYVPLLSLDKARRSYFIHERQVHSVESAPASVFKAAVHACIDLKRLADLGILQEADSVLSGPDDIYSRWYLVCYCAKSMRLYASKAEAEQDLQESASARE